MNNLAELEDKFDNCCSENDSSFIMFEELLELRRGLEDISHYFFDRREYTISSGIGNKMIMVERMIGARREAGLLDF